MESLVYIYIYGRLTSRVYFYFLLPIKFQLFVLIPGNLCHTVRLCWAMCCPALTLGWYLTGFSPVAAWRALKQPSVKMFEDASLAHVKVHRCLQHIKNNLKKESKQLRNAGTGKQRLKKSELELLPVLLSFLIDCALFFIFFHPANLGSFGNGGGLAGRLRPELQRLEAKLLRWQRASIPSGKLT